MGELWPSLVHINELLAHGDIFESNFNLVNKSKMAHKNNTFTQLMCSDSIFLNISLWQKWPPQAQWIESCVFTCAEIPLQKNSHNGVVFKWRSLKNKTTTQIFKSHKCNNLFLFKRRKFTRPKNKPNLITRYVAQRLITCLKIWKSRFKSHWLYFSSYDTKFSRISRSKQFKSTRVSVSED